MIKYLKKMFSPNKIISKPLETKSQLVEEIDRYLSNMTDYAFLITGAWGVGKSYYFENTLKRNIENTNVFDDNSIKYKCVRISLFGINSLDDIYNQLFVEIYPIWKTKGLKIGVKLLKLIFRAAVYQRNKGITNIDDYTKEADGISKELVDTSSILICFDDLERKSDSLSFKTLIGFINSLVENGNVKVIILANQDKIKEDEFKDIKEKVVGITVPFKQESAEIISNIIDKDFHSSSVFRNWLNQYKSIIFEVVNRQENPNYRALIYGLRNLHDTFSLISTKNVEIIENVESKKYCDSIISFTLLASIEFHNGAFIFDDDNYKELLNFENDFSKLFSFLHDDSKKDERYSTKIKNKYKSDLYSFYSYPSILQFVARGGQFNPSDLKAELNIAFPSGNYDPRKILIDTFIDGTINNNSNDEFLSKINEVLVLVDNGETGYKDLISLYYIINLYKEIIDFSSEDLLTRFKIGMDKSAQNLVYIEDNIFAMSVDVSSSNDENIIQLSNYARDLNGMIFEKNQEKYRKEINCTMVEDTSKFLEELAKKFNLKNSILSILNQEEFWNKFVSYENRELNIFLDFLNKRHSLSFNSVEEEKSFLLFLDNKITNHIDTFPNNLSKKLIMDIQIIIKKILK